MFHMIDHHLAASEGAAWLQDRVVHIPLLSRFLTFINGRLLPLLVLQCAALCKVGHLEVGRQPCGDLATSRVLCAAGS